MKLDIAVIGGGVAGAYTAWRLATERPGARIGLFEYSNRIGGRLLSVFLPGLPSVPAELGGMRFIAESHRLVEGLVEQFDLPTRDFPMGSRTAPKDGDPAGGQGTKPRDDSSRNLYFLRGKHFIEADFTQNPSKIPYALLPHETGMTPTGLQIRIMKLLGISGSDSIEDLYKMRVFGEPLYTFGFWNLVSRLVSAEAYAFMTDGGGYRANTANTNAVYQLPATEYGDGTEYRCLSRGFQSLPLSLEQRFRDAGGTTALGHALRRIEKHGAAYRLHFQKTRETKRRTHLDPAAAIETVEAASVVLAMPRRSLELIDWEPWHDRRVAHNLHSVEIQSAFKLALAYPSAWWRELGLEAGRSITDLPIRQCYYMPSEADFGDKANRSALMLATYNDINTVPFWRGLTHGRAFEGFQTPFTLHGAPEHTRGSGFAAPSDFPHPMLTEMMPHTVTEAMVDTAQEQLALLHRMKIPAPYAAAYHDWSDNPYGGGWHEWRAGFNCPQVIDEMLKPVDDEDVHVCGEAYSSFQGWVEGSLDTAETMLGRHFGLQPPRWAKDWKPGD